MRVPRMSVLKRMDELVSEHVVRLGRAYPDWHHNSPPQPFRHTAGALAEHALDDVGLLEVWVAGIEDHDLSA